MKYIKLLYCRSVLITLMTLLTSGCHPPSSTSQSQADNIIGGDYEYGYPEVGALVSGNNGSYRATCTATLIKPNWILTAAHCLKNGTSNLRFSIGSDASNGYRIGFAKVIMHPAYDDNPIGSLYDIALVRLLRSVDSNVAKPIPYIRSSIEPYLGKTALYIGYGTAAVNSQSGLGRKRRVELPIDRIGSVTFSTEPGKKGVCHGDSGGPILVKIDGQIHTIGVNSAAYGCQGGSCDPCTNGSKQTRVDRFYDWISSVISESYVPCSSTPSRCVCPQACGADGVCNHTVCATHSCGDITDCLFGECSNNPDGACSTACVEEGTIAARNQLRILVNCWAQKCRNIVGSAKERQCLLTNCSYEWEACQNQINPSVCGDSFIADDEDCEPGNLGGANCRSLGYTDGNLHCYSNCTFDFSECSSQPTCGNDQLDPGEICDGEVIDCTEFDPAQYESGAVMCWPDCSGWNVANCQQKQNTEEEQYTGTLSDGEWEQQPNGSYYEAVAGTHVGRLFGPIGSNFDLYLYKWSSSYYDKGWKKVASSANSDSTEEISYNGTSGYYTWVINADNGSGSYELWLTNP